MTRIISLLKRHYIGTAAEIAAVTGVCSDTAYETDTDIYKSWNGSGWCAGGPPFFVERLAAASDKQVGDFACNGVWQVNGLDLSAIVPAGAVAVLLHMNVLDDAASTTLSLRRDAVNGYNSVDAIVTVANINVVKVVPISIDSDRLLDYYASNLVFTSIDVTVIGWWLKGAL